jgi:hypothetical protein
MELGRPPKSITLWDRRTLFWPPTKDERELFLFRFVYSFGSKKGDEEGIGFVGSITWSFFSGETPRTPEDAYARHCMRELQRAGGERVPSNRLIAEGRKLLGFGDA